MTDDYQPQLQRGIFRREARQFLADHRIHHAELSLRHLELIARQFSQIPYENISKIIKYAQHQNIAFRMPDEIYGDFRRFRLGGTCFSLTFYLLEILGYCGYDCAPIMGDMKWGENVHSAILVDLHNAHYLVDPGYMIHRPLRISKDTQQRYLTPHSGIEIRFIPEVERFDLYTFRNGNHTWRYQFTPVGVDMEEFTQHWIESFTMPTMNGIILTKTANNEMVYVHNDYIKVTGREKVQRYNSRDTAEKVILDKFGIPLNLVEEARLALSKNRGKQEVLTDATD